jgi:hypothetical protein
VAPQPNSGEAAAVFTNIDPTIHATRGFEVQSPGEDHDLLTVQLGAGTLDHGSTTPVPR